MTLNLAGGPLEQHPLPRGVSLSEVAERGVLLTWDEALACAQLICEAIVKMASLWELDEQFASLTRQEGAALRPGGVPANLTGVFILASGEISVPSFGKVTEAQSIRFVGDMLSGAPTEAPFPAPLRAVIDGATTTPAAHESVAELSLALSQYERSDRREIVRALYQRADGSPPTLLPPVQTQAPRSTPIQTRAPEPAPSADFTSAPTVEPVVTRSVFQNAVAFARSAIAAQSRFLREAPRAATRRLFAARFPLNETVRRAATAVAFGSAILAAAGAGWWLTTRFALPVRAPLQASSASQPVAKPADPQVAPLEASPLVDTLSATTTKASASARSAPLAPQMAPVTTTSSGGRLATDSPGVVAPGIKGTATPRITPPASTTSRTATTTGAPAPTPSAPATIVNPVAPRVDAEADPLSTGRLETSGAGSRVEASAVARSIVYTVADTDVTPPVPVSHRSGEAPPAGSPLGSNFPVDVIIDETGHVETAVMARRPMTISESMFATMSLSAAKSWLFHPALKDGQPVRYRHTLWFAQR